MKRIDLVGQRFGKLTVVSFAGLNNWSNSKFLCKCDCGKEKIIPSGSLRQRNTGSCGCMSSNATIGKRSTTHGHSTELSGKNRHSSFYNRFMTIKARCDNPKNGICFVCYQGVGSLGRQIQEQKGKQGNG